MLPRRSNLLRERALFLLRYDRLTGNLIWITSRSGQPRPGSIAGSVGQDGYIKIRIDGVRYQAHRVIWLMETGEWPEDEIDHEDLCRSNNSWDNLREATHTQNMINVKCRKHNKSGLKGAYFWKGRWFSQIRVDGKQKGLGRFSSEIDAHNAYCDAASQHFGEFARF